MNGNGNHNASIKQAVDALRQADALLIMAGSGMSVASGIGTYRGAHGFDARHPEQLAAGWSYEQLASPAGLRQDPQRFWGFYGDRY
ncbi:MAG: Sir2 family transcriptional regulator, partial [Planctomycetota bacterium]